MNLATIRSLMGKLGLLSAARRYGLDCLLSRSFNQVRDEKGIALVTALMLTLISLTIAMALLYMITQGITTSAAQKRYHTSLEAAHGGVELFAKEIVPRLLKGDAAATLASDFSAIGLSISSSACLTQKLNMGTTDWSSCGAGSTTSDPKVAFDMTFRLNGAAGMGSFKIYSKIVDTTPGNSDSSGIDYLDSGSGVTGTSSGVSPKHIPALYRIEVAGEKEVNPNERALLSVLYAY